MQPEILLKIEKINSRGVIIGRETYPAKSLVAGFIGMLNIQLAQAYVSIIDITNTSRSAANYAGNFDMRAALNISTYGILAGTGTNAVAIGDYKLQTPITHGTGAGQLQHSSVENNTLLTVDANNAYFEMRRTLTNNSGATITIKEVAIYAKLYVSWTAMIERTAVNTAILNTAGVILTYKFLKTI